MAGDRTYTGGRFAFLTDGGEMLGFVKKFSGGTMKAEVGTHQLGPSLIQKKNITTISYEDMTVEVGMGMSKGMYEWIRAAFDMGHVKKSGEVHALDFDMNSKSIRQFRDTQITEVTLPACDGSSKDPAYMTIKMKPEEIIYTPGTGSQVTGKIAPATKKWLCSNFRFELGDLPTSRVAKVDSFTWKLAIAKDEVGQFRIPTLHACKVEVPNLKVTMSMADSKLWEDWHRSFLIDGNCGEDAELSGSITYLAPDLKEELGRIDLMNVGILSMQTADSEANKEEVARFTVELYVEQMKFEYLVSDA